MEEGGQASHSSGKSFSLTDGRRWYFDIPYDVFLLLTSSKLHFCCCLIGYLGVFSAIEAFPLSQKTEVKTMPCQKQKTEWHSEERTLLSLEF